MSDKNRLSLCAKPPGLAVIEAAAGIDDPVSRETVARAELARRMRGDGRTWKEIAAELSVAPSTAVWLAGRYRKGDRPNARRAIRASLGCAGFATGRPALSTSATSILRTE